MNCNTTHYRANSSSVPGDPTAHFALHADPDNAELASYAERIDQLRAEGKPTVPTTLSRELATNPFLRADDAGLQARWGGGDAVATFAALRAAKDGF